MPGFREGRGAGARRRCFTWTTGGTLVAGDSTRGAQAKHTYRVVCVRPTELYQRRAPGCRRELSFCKMLSLREPGKVYTDLSVLLFITAMPMNLQLSP